MPIIANNRQSGDKMKTLQIEDEVHERLRKAGVKGETFGQIINRLLDIAEKVDNKYDVPKDIKEIKPWGGFYVT